MLVEPQKPQTVNSQETTRIVIEFTPEKGMKPVVLNKLKGALIMLKAEGYFKTLFVGEHRDFDLTEVTDPILEMKVQA